MGTKNNPGAFDCYANAEPDEPMFVLLGRDRHAAGLVRLWALLRHAEGEDEAKVEEALQCADAMDAERLKRAGTLELDRFEALFMTATTGMDEHPMGFDWTCNCGTCLSYADDGDDSA